MKLLLILSLATLALSAKLSANPPENILGLHRSRSLIDDFKDIRALMPQRELTDLVRRYLTKDAEFQRIIMYFGSPEVMRVGQIIWNEPEIREFYMWLKEQMRSSRPLESLSDEDSSEELSNLLNYQQSNLQKSTQYRGWKGFMKELLAIYPRREIPNLIRDKVAANGVFTEFWNRVTALKPVYERFLRNDEFRKVCYKLRELGVDIEQLDQLIREDFGWRAGRLVLGNLVDQNTKLNQPQVLPVA